MKKIIVIKLIIALPILCFSQKNPKNQLNSYKIKKYLLENKHRIKYDTSDFNFMNKNIQNSDVFFVGETHGFSEVRKFAIHYMKYVKEKANFKYYLDEAPYSMGLKLNEYLKTGDESILINALNSLKGTYGWTKEAFNNYKAIYELNKLYKEEDKIRILAVDIEHVWKDTKQVLMALNEIANSSNSDQVIDQIGRSKCEDSLYYACKKFIEADQVHYESLLREQYFDFNHICLNMVYLKECRIAKNWDNTRDERIFWNFEKLIKRYNLKNEKFFGIWGYGHTYQKEADSVKWFAARIKQSELGMRILSVVDFEYRGKALAKTNVIKDLPKIVRLFKSYSKLNKTLYTETRILNSFWTGAGFDIKLLRKVSQRNTISMYDITVKDSPFYKIDKYSFGTSLKDNEFTADYYQYILFIRNSKAQVPLGNNNL